MTDLGSVSVCMATYNGEQFVRAQIESILVELGPSDEVVVVDDASSDGTVRELQGVADARVRLVENLTNVGYSRAFERALRLATGQHVFLADQDDVWPTGRVAVMQRALGSGSVVAGNVAILGGPSCIRGPFGARDWRLRATDSNRVMANLLRLAVSDMPYYGSAMAVRRDALEIALPFPPSAVELHDAWLALIGMNTRSLVHVEDRVVLRRLHDANTTGTPRSVHRILRGRLLFLRMCVTARRRAHRQRHRVPRRTQE